MPSRDTVIIVIGAAVIACPSANGAENRMTGPGSASGIGRPNQPTTAAMTAVTAIAAMRRRLAAHCRRGARWCRTRRIGEHAFDLDAHVRNRVPTIAGLLGQAALEHYLQARMPFLRMVDLPERCASNP